MRRYNSTEFSHHFPYGIPLLDQNWENLDLPGLLEIADKTAGTQPDITYCRGLSYRLNNTPHSEIRPHDPLRGSHLLAFSLISDVFRFMIYHYCHLQRPGSVDRALELIAQSEGENAVPSTLLSYLDYYPPVPVQLGEMEKEEYLNCKSEGISNRDDVVKEAILLSLQMKNPAAKPMVPLFDHKDLIAHSPYPRFIQKLEEVFDADEPVSGLGQTLFRTLRAPILANPDSLQGQWEYIARTWSSLLPDELASKLIILGDLLREEERIRGWGPPQSEVLTFRGGEDLAGQYPEYERYSHDEDWMPNVVLIAKSTYVWLDQLSKKYRRDIYRLDQIPNEELERLSGWGITGLWLIGVWERSEASRKIKQIRGNPEAVASAYSLWDYIVAGDLGGEEAYQDLSRRAWEHGIRLASDMVPNHVGIDSKWVHEHPDWFVQLEYAPYPNYQFTGENLSTQPSTGIYIEDGYWESRDAAVTFKRVDFESGHERHIYHGNDGTHMPWNDTAQLNYLNAEVREAVIQTILHVARKFPIIRFDAAMTLAKKHFQRLWFPPPGEGGDIPSRAERGMSRQEFDSLVPQEFWREVVDRVAVEAPGTLLLAEAFWLMEGYFVRTLGMHRVYNSAFMHMLKNEDNGKFRLTIKNVLEFSPQILQRFVNFMNNPDEDTAVAQFGKGDKYFGVAMTMVTMPGLPMIGHGQIEGFGEKYGMEYRKAYWDEQVDEDLVRRHEAEIFPLMRKRYLFAGAENFALYDFVTPEGHVDENIFAYSNRSGDERALIVYNHSYQQASGTVHTSTAINVGSQEQSHLVRKSLSEALGLKYDSQHFYILHDHKTHLEQIFSGQHLAEQGLYVELQGYQFHAFLGFKEVSDNDGSWWRLYESLKGKPVPSVEQAYMEMVLEPVLAPFQGLLQHAVEFIRTDPKSKSKISTLEKLLDQGLKTFGEAVCSHGIELVEGGDSGKALSKRLSTCSKVLGRVTTESSLLGLEEEETLSAAMAVFTLVRWISESMTPGEGKADDDWWETLYLDRRIQKQLMDIGLDESRAWRMTQYFFLMLSDFDGEKTDESTCLILLETERGKSLIQVHPYDGHSWFRKEEFQDFVQWIHFLKVHQSSKTAAALEKLWKSQQAKIRELFEAAELTHYRYDRLIGFLADPDSLSVEATEQPQEDPDIPRVPDDTP